MIGVMPLPALMNRSFSGGWLWQHEVALDAAERHDRSRSSPPHQVRGHLALIDALDGHADQAVRAVGIGGQRVRTPVSDAVDVDPDPQELPGSVPHPAVAGLDQDGRGVRGLVADLRDPAAKLARGPEGIDQLEVVIGQQRRVLNAPERRRSTRRWSGWTFGGTPRFSGI